MADEHTDRTTEKDPDDWVTGDEPMTGAQASYLDTLSREAGEAAPDDLSKAAASKLIDELQERTGRGGASGRGGGGGGAEPDPGGAAPADAGDEGGAGAA